MSRVTVRIDPHVHSEDSYDGHEPVELILEHAADIGLNAVVITDHDVMGESKRAADLAADYGLIGIPGVEVSTAHGHLLAIGVEEMPPHREPFGETVSWIHDHGGVAVVPHPFQRSRHGVRKKHIPVPKPVDPAATVDDSAAIVDDPTATVDEAVGTAEGIDEVDEVDEVDAVEVFNAWLFTGYRNRRARRFAAEHGYPGVAASDAHTLEYVGRAFTELEIDGVDAVADVTADDVLAAIREGTTTVSGKRAPVPMATKHYAIAAARKSGYYAKTGAVRSATTAKWAAIRTASTARVGALQGAHRLARIASWVR
ncbi:histidinol-phosphatase [Halorubrum sp. JWXQ-INN 858]|uniref:CehA/McbA family metallohydrolase n=1 Tax=Halorubrum sp. JWXQ-INN 858 TaxID=2690782 RepID=UPI0013F6DE22|nr:CehA/McbA family metallohydrolase [Halorubrum sp. JWXQ-INN 858]MWV63829.1 histidinol-phosphatase [Halorubrum sp. JWXQ-INN 858]